MPPRSEGAEAVPVLFMRENRNAVSFDDVFGKLGPTAETCIGLICAVKKRRNAARAARL